MSDCTHRNSRIRGTILMIKVICVHWCLQDENFKLTEPKFQAASENGPTTFVPTICTCKNMYFCC